VSGLKYYFTIATAVEEDSGEEHMFDAAFVIKHECSIKIMEAALESSSVEVAHREDFGMERGLTTSRWTSAFRRPIDAPRGLHHGEAAHHLEVDFGGVVVGLDSDDGEVDFSVEVALDIDDVLGSGWRPYLEVQVVALTSGRLMMAGLDLGLEVFVIIENLFFVPANISG
jgi:hypothetical protein